MAVLKSSHEEKTLLQLKIVETKKISWRDIVPFQPKGFKIGNTDGLRKSIANNELIDRFKVFTIPGSKKYFMFDGHTRHKVMREMEEDNLYSFPDELEVDVLKFNDKKTAAFTLLEYQAGKLKISELGLVEFAEQINDTDEELQSIIDDYGIDMVHDKGMDQDDLNSFFAQNAEPGDNVNKKKKITLEYTDEDYEKVIDAFEKLSGTKEQIVFKLLNCK